MPEFKVTGSTPTGVREELFEVEGWTFFGDTKHWSPEAAQLVTRAINDAEWWYGGNAWSMLLEPTKKATVMQNLIVPHLREADWTEAHLQALRLVEFDCFEAK